MDGIGESAPQVDRPQPLVQEHDGRQRRVAPGQHVLDRTALEIDEGSFRHDQHCATAERANMTWWPI